MTADEMRVLSDEDLIKICMERNDTNGNYTGDAIIAQRVYQNRKGGFQNSYYDGLRKKGKVDRSCYSDRYY